MARIIAGGFDVYSKTQAALQRLRDEGIPDEYVCEFRVNPPGEHHRTPIGGDQDKSPGAKHAESGATKGAAVGAALGTALGAVATPLVGPAAIVAGAGVGGYTGSLVGSLGEVSREPQPDEQDVRPAEALVAVNIDAAGVEQEAIVGLFEACGAKQVEVAEGLWENGQWIDFDAVQAPNLIGGEDFREHHRGI